MAAVRGRQHPTDTSLISSTTNPNTARYLQDNCGNGNWYTVSKALLIRMNFGTPNSIDESNLNLNFNVYPNPSNGKFVVENLNDNSYDLVIHNIFGQEVYFERDINKLENKIDISKLSSGVYTVELKNHNSTYITKLIKE